MEMSCVSMHKFWCFMWTSRKKSDSLIWGVQSAGDVLQKAFQIPRKKFQSVPGQQQKWVESCKISWGGREEDGNYANPLQGAKPVYDPTTSKTTISGSIFLVNFQKYLLVSIFSPRACSPCCPFNSFVRFWISPSWTVSGGEKHC